MKRFRFKLERILSLRAYKEREWELKLAGATGKCIQLMREIEDRTRMKTQSALRNIDEREVVKELVQNHLYMSRLDQEMQNMHVQLIEREKEREEIQTAYLEASKDRKVLSNLKEKRSNAYSKERRVEEAKELDDINTGRTAHQRSQSGEKSRE